jgi:hypothetical protein
VAKQGQDEALYSKSVGETSDCAPVFHDSRCLLSLLRVWPRIHEHGLEKTGTLPEIRELTKLCGYRG